jgi:hypothetical protein
MSRKCFYCIGKCAGHYQVSNHYKGIHTRPLKFQIAYIFHNWICISDSHIKWVTWNIWSIFQVMIPLFSRWNAIYTFKWDSAISWFIVSVTSLNYILYSLQTWVKFLIVKGISYKWAWWKHSCVFWTHLIWTCFISYWTVLSLMLLECFLHPQVCPARRVVSTCSTLILLMYSEKDLNVWHFLPKTKSFLSFLFHSEHEWQYFQTRSWAPVPE